ncbi:SAM-dependent chlorinase/fluorinase [Ilyomonas limi]|uniref:SAM-dependent chlorinase/fluorinase n=1 Tax=Ilyomonas limi TaxID=2575867 RepID=A0A4U3L0K5_9BACT|nr:SAM-dependent chlorinase/fluorinase [Ilyomonas limi]TKK67006.1 SAM-dependent chlorinase/fluorinase [Ilyomonas limi]
MPIATLSTDIGTIDYLSGAIKGQLLTAHPALNIVDVTHTLSPSNYQQTAYICSNAYKYFPPGTLHILIINLFETSPDKVLFAEYNNQYIICPDNGILTMITGAKPEKVYAVAVQPGSNIGTLHYTQTVAKAIGKILGGTSITDIGQPVNHIVEKYPLRSTIGTNWIEGQIIFIDHFENVVVNITREEFEEHRKGRDFKIEFMRGEVISSLSENYAAVSPGEKLAWFNASGLLEIAINKGNMAGLFGLYSYASEAAQSAAMHHKYFYQTVRIYFESQRLEE